jgi:hypothetical protein
MGRLSTVDLLALTSLDRLLLILHTLFTCFTKQVNLMRRSTVLSLPLPLVFPGKGLKGLQDQLIFYQSMTKKQFDNVDTSGL